EAAGCEVAIAVPGACCGLNMSSTGQLTAAKRQLTNTVNILHPYVVAGYQVVGLEASCTAPLRSDLPEVSRHTRDARTVSDQVKTVAERPTTINRETPQLNRKLMVQVHCHHYSIMGF